MSLAENAPRGVVVGVRLYGHVHGGLQRVAEDVVFGLVSVESEPAPQVPDEVQLGVGPAPVVSEQQVVLVQGAQAESKQREGPPVGDVFRGDRVLPLGKVPGYGSRSPDHGGDQSLHGQSSHSLWLPLSEH